MLLNNEGEIRMKILQINAVLHKGSTGIIAKSIGDYAESKGNTALYATMEPGHNSFEYQIGTDLDHKIHAMKCRLFGKQGYYSNRATKKFLEWIDSQKPDIIHIHNLHSNYLNFPMLFRYIQARNIPTVITLHDCWFLTGKCFHFLYDHCQNWKEECGNCVRLHKEQNSLFFDKTKSVLKDKKELIGNNKNVTVVAVSDWLANVAKESILKNREIHVVNNGVNVELFTPDNTARSRLGFSEDVFIILGMANKWLIPENAEAFSRITANLSENNILLLIGCTQEQAATMPKNVVCVGNLLPTELAKYYSAADVFVNVTRVDSFPTVNIEALACGTPVISYISGGSAECIVESENGYSVECGDVEKLERMIEIVKTNGKERYSPFCRESAMQNYDMRYCYAEYLEIYENLMKNTTSEETL